jgi:hypothetical protein
MHLQFCRPLYEIFAVNPWSSSPQFRVAGSLALDGLIANSNTFSCTPGMYVIHCDRGPVLWDWEQDSWIQLPIDDPILKASKFI